MHVQDNATPHTHTARGTTGFLVQHDVEVMDWPSRSLDMYPIEHFWDQTMVFIRDMNEPPFIVPEMWRAVLQAWVVILPRRVMTLVDWYTACHIHCMDIRLYLRSLATG